MKSARFALFAAPLVLLAGFRSEVEQRPANAQASNICTLAAKDGVANHPDAEMEVRIRDLDVGRKKGTW